VLRDTRDEKAFIDENQAAVAAAGYDIVFIESGATMFWASAEPILMSVTLNLIVYSLVIALALSVTLFLYFRMSTSNTAILRAIGIPVKGVFRQQSVVLLLLGLPAVVIGGAAGWQFALSGVASILTPLETAADALASVLEKPLQSFWLAIFIAAVFIVLLIISTIGAVVISRRPVLALLRDRVKR